MADAIKLDLGCGPFKKEGYVGIDVFNWSDKYPKDEFLCGAIPEVLHNFKDKSILEVRASHFIEHIPQPKVIETFNEIHRILIVGGILDIKVPPSTGRGAFCDPSHVSFYNDMSWRYYDLTWCKDLSNSYGITADFEIIENKLIDEFNLHAILKKR